MERILKCLKTFVSCRRKKIVLKPKCSTKPRDFENVFKLVTVLDRERPQEFSTFAILLSNIDSLRKQAFMYFVYSRTSFVFVTMQIASVTLFSRVVKVFQN